MLILTVFSLTQRLQQLSNPAFLLWRTTMAVLTASRRTIQLACSWPVLVLGLALGVGLLLLVMLASIGFGAADIGVADVWAALFAFDPSSTIT
jgi:hypothetical protein